jgi:AP-1-like factor
MALTGIYDQSYQLDSNQQDLLAAALGSNQPNEKPINRSDQDLSNAMGVNPYQTSPEPRHTPGSSGMEGSLESPFIDYEADYDFDGSYDFPDGEMIGTLPGTSGEFELHDKRKSFDGEEDDDEGGGKRQETDEKSSKKPGRKPLVTEPTTVSLLTPRKCSD